MIGAILLPRTVRCGTLPEIDAINDDKDDRSIATRSVPSERGISR